MNDHELIAAVRESVAGVHTATPVEQIVSRGRAVRARRWIPGLAAALAAAAGAAVAVTALLPASHPASHRPHPGRDQLTAWTVVKHPNGDVSVTIHEMFYPAGLQGKLRADGVPASVTFGAGHRHPSPCRPYPASRALLSEVFPPGAPAAAIVIRPSALPPGAGVYIDDTSNPYGYVGLETGLVHASPRCTGS
jgi:hypothetical protein